MEMNFNEDLMQERNSDIIMTLGTKLSLNDAIFINNSIYNWSKF